MHFEIFTFEQRSIFSKLNFVKKLGLYLAGGTALALQLGHRTSIDFDFYTKRHFRKGEFLKFFKQGLKNFSLKVLRDQDDTFEAQINGVHLSCFYYPYKLVGKLIEAYGIPIASVEDAAAMKLVAISQRGKRRDFIDIFYLIKKLGLKKILSLAEEKYPEFDIYNGLRGLVYFTDADADKEVFRIRALKDIRWLEIKKFIKDQVKKFQKL